MGFFFRRKKPKQSEETPKENVEQNDVTNEVIPKDEFNENHDSVASLKKSAIDNNTEKIKSDTSENSTTKLVSEDTVTENITPKEEGELISTSLDTGLSKSSSSLLGSLGKIFSSGIEFNEDIFEELEDTLISADIGVNASMNMIDALRQAAKNQKLKTAQAVVNCLQEQASEELAIAEKSWNFNLKPYVIMMVGVNGVGKTTTTAKIARHFQKQGKNVMLAAADTFRAAATEQLIEWGNRLDIPVIHQAQGSDAAAVAHDAFNSALARNIDILIIDTAGRLHTQTDLMDQLGKVTRVLKKIDEDTPHEIMQVLDSTTGQNAMSQLKHFKDAVGVNSLCLTKLDGSAKGGVAISLAQEHQLPIRFIGIGEGFDDLRAFSSNNFAKALIPDVED